VGYGAVEDRLFKGSLGMSMGLTRRTTAGFNEQRVKALMLQKAPGIGLRGKQRFSDGNVEISVDESFTHGEKEYLLEIDSGNMAKLLVGQYVLLNQLRKDAVQPAVFLVVHAYRAYNPDRTLENLRLVNRQLYKDSGIPFGAVHVSALENCATGLPQVLALFGHA
jgi:hypothetical protein